MIKISKMADYALVVLAMLAEGQERQMNAALVAEKTRLPEPTVAKVLKLLAREDIVSSSRGAAGGYALAKTPEQINVADIIVAIDGPVSMVACIEGSTDHCDFKSHCGMQGRWDGVNDAVLQALESISLAEMMAPKAAKIKSKESDYHERV